MWVRIAGDYRTTLTSAIRAAGDDLAADVVNHTFAWVADNPSRAELLMRFRTEDFTPADWPEEVIAAIEATNQALAADLADVAQRLGLDPLDVILALIDIPAAAARRSLLLRSPRATGLLRRRGDPTQPDAAHGRRRTDA